MTKAPHVQAAFINAIREEGTKEDACDFLQKQWNETCALQARVEELEDTHDNKALAWDMMCKARAEGRLQGLDEARQQAAIVERDGSYFGDIYVDSTDSIYRQGACEVREAIEALKEQSQ